MARFKNRARRNPSAALRTVAVALLLPSPIGAQAPASKPSFPTQAELVTVDAVVTGRDGEPVLDLRREDFTVKEDGAAQDIVAFEAVHRPAAPTPAAGAPLLPEPRSTSNLREPGREPASFVIVFDELHLGVAEAQRARKAVLEFLGSGLAGGDRVALVGTHEGVRWTARMPEGREALEQALARLQPRMAIEQLRDRMTDYEAMRIDRDRDPIVTDVVMRRYLDTEEILQDTASPGNPVPNPSDQTQGWRDQVLSRAAGVYARATARNEQTLGIVARSLEALAAERGRKSVVFASGGLIQDPRLGIYRQVVTAARRVNAAVYFLDARGLSAAQTGLEAEIGTRTEFNDLGSWFTEARERGEGSQALAADTGGFSLTERNDLGPALLRVGRESRSYYLLGYALSNRKADGRFHTIEVKVAREGVRVRARRGYYAPGGDEKQKQPVEGRDAAFQRALDAPFDLPDVPLRAIADVFAEKEPGKADVRLTVEADVHGFAFVEKGGTARDALELLLLVARRDTGEFTRFDQQFEMSLRPESRARYERDGFPIVREIALAPGRYQARVVARDRNSGRVGSLLLEFEVPELAGLRVSSLALTDRLGEVKGGGPPAPEPTARRQFAPAGVLHCRFEVYEAGKDAATGQPRVTAGFSIRRSDGRFLAAMPETALQPAPGGSLSRSLGVPLDGAPTGLYEVIVVVTDLAAGRSAEARETFEIRPDR
ncbi:MAG TPA: VWA domain-containing protein [Vicinamibacteria bacterium]|nr:VWA domain-containing protein [Vicinamibacteria bacterium]